jgi:XTP/dITP diphosphohydrolase
MPGSHRITLVLATRNLHKVAEIRSILSEQFQYRTLNDLPGAPAVVEDAATFEGNAAKKAEQLAEWILANAGSSEFRLSNSETFVLADDSGLEVDALGGAPGVHSARFAALDGHGLPVTGNSPDAANNAKLLGLLHDVPMERRTARFRCVLALAEVSGPVREKGDDKVCDKGNDKGELRKGSRLFAGVCEGRIDYSSRGQGGFGYDPLFVPIGYGQSFAELGEAVKNSISHRAKALERLKEWLEKRRFSE